jgi:hypothetical protein
VSGLIIVPQVVVAILAPCRLPFGEKRAERLLEAVEGGEMIKAAGASADRGGDAAQRAIIEAAQFIYLLLQNQKIRDVIDTMHPRQY